MKKLRIVLGGLGVRGSYWAEVIRRSSRSEVVAYADPNPEALARANAQYGEVANYASVEEALEDLSDVDAVVLANPPIGRESQIRAAVDRAIPLMVEKPLALDLVEASHLVQIVEGAGVPMMIGLNFRYLGVTLALQTLLREGQLGQPEFSRFTYERWRDGNRPDLNKYPLTMDQPMLWEQSIHHFDLMRYVYQQEPVLVQAQTWNPSWSMYESDANVAALIRFDGGMVVNYQGTWQSSWAEPHFEWRTECDAGLITQRDQFSDLFYAKRDDSVLTPVPLPAHERWITDTSGLHEAFLNTIIDDAPLQCSGRDHLMSLAMLQACIVSSQTGQGVTIASVLPESL